MNPWKNIYLFILNLIFRINLYIYCTNGNIFFNRNNVEYVDNNKWNENEKMLILCVFPSPRLESKGRTGQETYWGKILKENPRKKIPEKKSQNPEKYFWSRTGNFRFSM